MVGDIFVFQRRLYACFGYKEATSEYSDEPVKVLNLIRASLTQSKEVNEAYVQINCTKI